MLSDELRPSGRKTYEQYLKPVTGVPFEDAIKHVQDIDTKTEIEIINELKAWAETNYVF